MSDEDICEITCIDEEKVASVKGRMASGNLLPRLAEIFKLLGDATRLKIIHALSLEELCVCDIACLLGTTKSAVSHQLRILRNMNAVRFRKDGKIVFYSLDDTHVSSLFNEGLQHILSLEERRDQEN
jgi:DNA-binding transcriptional ArsR family regulator